MKEMTSVATTMMTDEEKAAIEQELKGKGTSTPTVQSPTAEVHGEGAHDKAIPSMVSNDINEEVDSEASLPKPQHSALSVPTPVSPTPSASSKEKERDIDLKEMKERRKMRLTPEQKEKLDALEKERKEVMEKRVKELHRKLVDRYEIFFLSLIQHLKLL